MPRTHLAIPAPCAASWAAMTPTAAGRHCAACQKTVVDFTWKTDAEILAILRQAAGETCGRLRTDQLNRPLIEMAAASSGTRWRTWLAAALALWVARESNGLGAQARTRPTPSSHHAPTKSRRPSHSPPAAKLLRGTVCDAATHEPLAGVAVFLKGESRTTTTDSAGQFSLRLPAQRPRTGRALTLHAAGYQSENVSVPASSTTALQLTLQADPAAAGATIVGYGTQIRTSITGGMIAIATEPPPSKPMPWHPRSFWHWLTRPFRS